ncbi:MAG: NAD(P)/FAD-dependent oxidoreductase [Chloroflexi bacterium]|nr:NAD(P)/FAD-dependent oxidoreductase [Chloroflexota bacterium]
MSQSFDVLVIGGGGAGYAAASTAARLGKQVAMAERWKLGGTCLNVGCVPTKALLRSAHVAETVRRSAEFGIDVDGWKPDYPRIVARARSIIESFSGEGPETSLASQGITLLTGSITFVSPHDVECDGQRYTADRFVIASGSTSQIPPLPGLDDVPYLTSDQALWLENLPTSAVIIGGGIISCEFASLWAALGTDVTIVSRRLLSGEDPEVGDALRTAFEARGIRVVGGRAVGLEQVSGRPGVRVKTAEDGDLRVAAEVLLMATGRQPLFHDLNLSAAGVRTGERGIVVDDTMQTSAPHIWAAGDVTGRHMYTHAGDYAAEVAGWNAAGGEPERSVDWRVVPRPVYAIPEVAAIGLVEAESRRQGLDIEVASVCYADITRAVLEGAPEGFAKIIAERSTGQIVGASIVGVQACELIGEVAVAMAGRVSAWLVGDTQHPYPTLSEVVRWAADQIGKTSRPEGDQAAGQPVAIEHTHPLGSWPTEGSQGRAVEHASGASSLKG